MNLQIATLAKVTYETDSVKSCTIPTADGEITVLNNHIPLVSLLQPGVIKVVHDDSSVEYVAISTGMLEVRTEPGIDTEIVILADQADRAGSIDLAMVERAKVRAEEALKQPQTLSEEEYKTLVADLAMQEARIKAGSRI